MRMRACPKCDGSRLKPESRAVTLDSKSLGEISSYSIKNIKISNVNELNNFVDLIEKRTF